MKKNNWAELLVKKDFFDGFTFNDEEYYCTDIDCVYEYGEHKDGKIYA